jgi:hypothetical protein
MAKECCSNRVLPNKLRNADLSKPVCCRLQLVMCAVAAILRNGVSATTTLAGFSAAFIATMGVCPAASSAEDFPFSLLPGASDSTADTWKLTRWLLFLAFASRSVHGAVFFRDLEGFCIAGGNGGGENFDDFCSFVGGFSAAGTLLLLTWPNVRRVGLERRSKTSPQHRNEPERTQQIWSQ